MEMMLREQRAMEQMKVVEKKEAVQAMHREMREKTCCPPFPIVQLRLYTARSATNPWSLDRALEKQKTLERVRQDYERRLSEEVRTHRAAAVPC